eukprot:3665385-Pleurochrysis_carterae.AAC.1
MHLRGACATRAYAALARAARRQPRACISVMHAVPERPLRLRAPLDDDLVHALACWCKHSPSGCCACARRSATTSCMHLRSGVWTPERLLRLRAPLGDTHQCVHPRGACTTRAAVLARAARCQPRALFLTRI